MSASSVRSFLVGLIFVLAQLVGEVSGFLRHSSAPATPSSTRRREGLLVRRRDAVSFPFASESSIPAVSPTALSALPDDGGLMSLLSSFQLSAREYAPVPDLQDDTTENIKTFAGTVLLLVAISPLWWWDFDIEKVGEDALERRKIRGVLPSEGDEDMRKMDDPQMFDFPVWEES